MVGGGAPNSSLKSPPPPSCNNLHASDGKLKINYLDIDLAVVLLGGDVVCALLVLAEHLNRELYFADFRIDIGGFSLQFNLHFLIQNEEKIR